MISFASSGLSSVDYSGDGKGGKPKSILAERGNFLVELEEAMFVHVREGRAGFRTGEQGLELEYANKRSPVKGLFFFLTL